jgi:hypothetical protein
MKQLLMLDRKQLLENPKYWWLTAPPSYKKKELTGCQENLNGWMSYSFNYKSLWLYFKTKALSVVSWSVDYCSSSVLRSLKTEYLLLKPMQQGAPYQSVSMSTIHGFFE